MIYTILHNRDLEEYIFITKAGITYSCLFVLADEEFGDYPEVASIIYFFYLNAIKGNPGLQGPDEAIGATVAIIVENFMLQNDTAVIYFCDPMDNRELLRKRKFDHWFLKFSTARITRFDSKLQAGNSYILHTLLTPKNHPLMERIVSIFLLLTKNIDEKPDSQ